MIITLITSISRRFMFVNRFFTINVKYFIFGIYYTMDTADDDDFFDIILLLSGKFPLRQHHFLSVLRGAEPVLQ